VKRFRSTRRALLCVPLLAASLVMAAPGAHAESPTPVSLGTADPFAILAGSGITDGPPVLTSVIAAGDVGVNPNGGASITGLTCPLAGGGTVFVNDVTNLCYTTNASLVLGAQNASNAAWVDVGGRGPVIFEDVELGGETLVPGVYANTAPGSAGITTFQITAGAGPLVLDGQGDLNGVFIFQSAFAGTGLTVGPGSTVSLINGAQACNVFWWVQTATIDTGATFKGTILALTSITVANGSNIEGRLLAQNGNVTLINDTITRPVCATPTAGPSPTEGTAGGAGGAGTAPTAVIAVPRTTG